jgi:hypothetical protein
MKDFLNQLLTGKDNQTQDIARWSWLISLAAVIVLAGYEVTNSTVSIRELAEAFGIIAGAHGAAVMLKKDTEPSEEVK